MIALCLLAAGGARRFGVPKALLPAGPGETLLSRALRQALPLGPTTVVVGYEAELHRQALQPFREVTVLENQAWASGQSSSLRLALRWAQAQGAAGLLVALPDQPALQRDHLEALIQAFRPELAGVVATFQGTPRSPALLGARLFPQLQLLQGDQGARSLLRSATPLAQVTWNDPLLFEDVDTWDAYEALARRFGWDTEPSDHLVDSFEELKAAWPHQRGPERLGWLRAAALSVLHASASLL
jgi:molybdenum cofactor cytidylyltransferase